MHIQILMQNQPLNRNLPLNRNQPLNRNRQEHVEEVFSRAQATQQEVSLQAVLNKLGFIKVKPYTISKLIFYDFTYIKIHHTLWTARIW